MDKIEPKYISAEKRILEIVQNLDINDKVPGERVFAKQLNISYMTARKAVDSLVGKGILYRVAKKGTYLASRVELKKKTKNIGYFLDSSITDGLTSPYYSLIFDALEKEATNNGYALMYCSDFNEAESLKKMKKIDGAIISCFPRVENVIQSVNKLVPVVCIDNRSAEQSIPSVVIDNFNSVVESTKHLCSLGHEQIGFITGLDDSDIGRNRLDGYLAALESCGISKNLDLVYRGDYSFETGKKGADYFLSLDKQPTAIMCANDTMAIGAIKEITQRGLKVPDDISIIGFDDITVAAQMSPALTTASAPVGEIAKHAVSILNSIINGTEPEYRHITLPCRLIVRDTCAPANNKRAAGKDDSPDRTAMLSK